MNTISVATDIIPIADLKTNISQWFRKLRENGRPLIITQNGKPAGVLLSPEDYDELVYRKSFLDSVGRGTADAESGKMYGTEEMKLILDSRRLKV